MTSKLLVTSHPSTETSLLLRSVKTANGPLTVTRLPSSSVKARRVWTTTHSTVPPTPPSSGACDSDKGSGESNDKKLALNTVRSAPASRRSLTATQLPADVSTAASTTGLMIPSSNVCHRPLISIDAFASLPRDVLHRGFVVRVVFLRQPLRFPIAVRNENFPFRHGNVPSTILLKERSAVLRQPFTIAAESSQAAVKFRIFGFFSDSQLIDHEQKIALFANRAKIEDSETRGNVSSDTTQWKSR